MTGRGINKQLPLLQFYSPASQPLLNPTGHAHHITSQHQGLGRASILWAILLGLNFKHWGHRASHVPVSLAHLHKWWARVVAGLLGHPRISLCRPVVCSGGGIISRCGFHLKMDRDDFIVDKLNRSWFNSIIQQEVPSRARCRLGHSLVPLPDDDLHPVLHLSSGEHINIRWYDLVLDFWRSIISCIDLHSRLGHSFLFFFFAHWQQRRRRWRITN